MKNFINKLKAGLVAFWIALISFSPRVFGIDGSEPNGYEYISDGQVLTGRRLLDIVSHRIHRTLIIIVFSVLIIYICVILKTKDKEKRRKTKKISIIVAFCAVLISIIYDIISWWLKTQNMQQIYGVPQGVEVQIGGKSAYPEDTIYSLPEPKTSIINVIVNLAQRIVPVITFIIGIVSFIRIMMTKDKTLKEKRIKTTIIVMSILIILIVGISVAARFLNN